MQTYQFRHKNRSVVRAGVSNDLYIVLSARGEGAKLACEIVEEMVLAEGRRLLGYPTEKIVYLLSEQLQLASEMTKTPIRCSLAFAAADVQNGQGWLFSAGSAAAFCCNEKEIQKALNAQQDEEHPAYFPEQWDKVLFESLLVPPHGALVVCTDPAAIRRLRGPLLEKLCNPAFPKRTKAEQDYSYAVLLTNVQEEVQEDV